MMECSENARPSAGMELLATARPTFLLVTPICVFLGIAAARHVDPGAGSALTLSLILVGAVLAHASVNMLNEYEDFRSGLDALTQRTPFSGGTGTLLRSPGLAPYTLMGGVLALVGTAGIGLYFTVNVGAAILPVGLLGLLVAGTYSTHMVHSPLACLLAPGLGVGVLMVSGTVFALTGHYSGTALLASMLPFFLGSNLLLLNQFPDVEADRQVGRRNFPIILGRRRSALIYATLLMATYVTIVAAVVSGYFPRLALIGLGTAIVGLPVCIGVYRRANDLDALLPLMGLNVAITLATPLLVGVGLLLGK